LLDLDTESPNESQLQRWLGDSEMAGMVLAFDWSRTPLGPIASWPQSLKTAVAICLRSPFQMAIYWGSELNLIYNDAERDVLGDLHPGALGLPARELLHDSWEITGPQLRAVMERGDTTWAENQPLPLNRRGVVEIGYFTYSYSPIVNDDGQVGGVLLVTKDTTERVLAERRLAAMRELPIRSMDANTERQACEQTAAALAGTEDVAFALMYLIERDRSSAACVATSAKRGELHAAHQVVELGGEDSDERSRLFRALADRRADGVLIDSSLFVAPGRDARSLPRRAFAAPIAHGATDPIAGFVVAGIVDGLRFDDACETFVKMAAIAVGRSVAAARARESERERADAIAALDRAKTSFFSDAAHELRTPLALILGNLDQALDQGQFPASAREPLMAANRSAQRMLKLVEALLDFSRIEAGGGLGELRAMDVARLTRETAAIFRATVERAGLRLVVDCPSLPERVCVDPDAWERIVSNLVSNAVKFTPDGEIRVRTRAERGELCLTVADTGIGVPAKDRERIFERFYRVPDARARAHEGLGIGLALVRELIQLHGGSIAAESRQGSGTTMVVRVPLAGDDMPGVEPREQGSRMTPSSAAALFVAEADGWFDHGPALPDERSRETVRALVAEDNADMREYLRRLLSPHFSVVLARDGTEALKLALRERPSVVVSDVMMPGLDGFELIRELRRDPRTRDVPIMLVSARADPESTLKALSLGADDYIIKPFGGRELIARVRSTVEGSRIRADAADSRGRAKERRHTEGELRALLNDLRAAHRRVAAATEAERVRVARDLHDGAQQRLTAIRLELGILGESLDGGDRKVAAKLAELRAEFDAALTDLRELVQGLDPPLLASDGLYEALSAAARRAGMPVTVDGKDLRRVPGPIESAAYFCCLEAMQNSAKHGGPGAHASIRLTAQDGVLVFRVQDDGIGFDAELVHPGHGLINMRDRLDALGGQVDVTSVPGRGTTVVGQIPLP